MSGQFFFPQSVLLLFFSPLVCILPGLEHKDPEEGMEAREISHEWSCSVKAHSWVLLRTYPTLICSPFDDDAPFQLVFTPFVTSRHLVVTLVCFSLHPSGPLA